MKTKLNNLILSDTLAVLYLCKYDINSKKLNVIKELQFHDSYIALQMYANIPNPESQLVTGKTNDELVDNLKRLHENMEDPFWLNNLEESI